MPYLVECREWRLLQALGSALEGRKAHYIASGPHVHFHQNLFEYELRRVFTHKDSNEELSNAVFEQFRQMLNKLCGLLNHLVKPAFASGLSSSPTVYPHLHALLHFLEGLIQAPPTLELPHELFDLASGPHQTLFRLPLEPSELKNELDRLTEYNDVVGQLLSTRRSPPNWSKLEANSRGCSDTRLRDRAATVLEILFQEFKCGGRHEVMLRLSGGLDKATPRQRLHLLLSCCWGSDLWQETLCDLCEDEDSITNIINICDDLQLYSGKGKKLRLLIERYKIFGAWTGTGSDAPFAENFHKQSLHEMLLNHTFKPPDIEYFFGNPCSIRYNIKQKRTLAVQLGYCLMEFFDSVLDSKNLHLFVPSRHYTQNELLYLSFSSGLSISTQPRFFQVGDPVLVSFAKLLLEIDLGQRIPIEISPHDREKNQLNWAKLHSCIEKIAEERDDSYLQAVRGCLIVHSTISQALRLCDARGKDAELTIRREIYKEVVNKLEIGLKESLPRPHDKRRRSESPPPSQRSLPGETVMVAHSSRDSERASLQKRQRQSHQYSMNQHLLPSRTQWTDTATILHSGPSQTGQPTITSTIHAYGAYKIAIICPMAVEMAPALAMLDHEHSRHRSKRNVYVLGQMGHHHVIVTVMPETGNNSAAAMASQLQNDFPSLEFALLVGIGGGVPDMDKHDIRLGDVVVSKPTQTFGGVVQFDHGKLNTNNQFERTGLLNKPPPIVMSNLELLIAEHKRDENRLNDHLTNMMRTFPNMKNEQYIHQGEENDVLFESCYPHHSGTDCQNCLREKIVKRQPRYSTAPRIHYGTIGSSNIVVKDARLRDNLRDELGILCVEMEAAGLVDEFPCLVIRGICDYADSHKLKKWQPYAAATAAAFAKEFLSHFQADMDNQLPVVSFPQTL